MPKQKKDTADRMLAKEQFEKGEIRLEMKFTPLMAHRYIQKQINDMCLAFKKEKNMNE